MSIDQETTVTFYRPRWPVFLRALGLTLIPLYGIIAFAALLSSGNVQAAVGALVAIAPLVAAVLWVTARSRKDGEPVLMVDQAGLECAVGRVQWLDVSGFTADLDTDGPLRYWIKLEPEFALPGRDGVCAFAAIVSDFPLGFVPVSASKTVFGALRRKAGLQVPSARTS